MIRHSIQASESLADLAATYRLSGWQGLYFAHVNAGFRRQYPDPWRIPPGVEIGIPTSRDEQFYALQWRCADLQRLEDRISRLADTQRQLLLAPFGTTSNVSPRSVVAELAQGVVRSTATAVGLLNAPDWTGGHRDLALLDDALQRWRIDGAEAAASLFSLLTRAVQGVPWAVPANSARAWCDPSSAQFWAKPFIAPRHALLDADAQAQRHSVRVMLSAQRAVVDQLVRQVRSLRTGAIMETNYLARLAEDDD